MQPNKYIFKILWKKSHQLYSGAADWPNKMRTWCSFGFNQVEVREGIDKTLFAICWDEGLSGVNLRESGRTEVGNSMSSSLYEMFWLQKGGKKKK